MALYYDIPEDVERLAQDTRGAALRLNVAEFREALLVDMQGSLKVIIDGNIGRDYSATYTVHERLLLDPRIPKEWEGQVLGLIEKHRQS